MSWLFSWRPAQLPDSWAPEHGWAMTRALIWVAILACLGYAVLARLAPRLSARARRVAHTILIAVLGGSALLSVAVYLDFGLFRYGTYLNEWDFYHYYLGSKYAPELGYTKLYGATLLADAEAGARYHNPQGAIRDLATAELGPTAAVLREPQRYRNAFSPQRWSDFVADVTWFRQQLPPARWSLLLVDHGYNGTPAWSFVLGDLVTRHLSVRAPLERWLMLLLDPALLLTSVLVVAWAFGWRTAFVLVIFVGTHYLMSWGHLKGALLRTDFAMGTVLAVCAVKKHHFVLAGVCLGWAILSRVFPVLFLLVPVVLLARHGLCDRRLHRPWLALLAACVATVVLVGLASCLRFGGWAIWREWAEKISLHYAGGSDWDVGLRTVLAAGFSAGVPTRHAHLGAAAAWSPAMLAAVALLLLPALYFLRGLAEHEALAYGFVFVFLLSVATYYYYLVLCVPLLFFAPELEQPQGALGTAFMLFTGFAGYVFFSGWRSWAGAWVILRGWHQTFPTYYYSSCLVGITVVQMIALAASRARARNPRAVAAAHGG
ncbi:MAG: hypothetical protein ABSB49_16165 [Polyangia bacterium]